MRELYRLALSAWPVENQAEEAIAECSRFSASVAVCLLRGHAPTARVAAAIAEMEVICQRLRQIVGEDLVDLEKVAVLHRLARRVHAAAESKPARQP